ncbi:MAG: ATP-binding protein [Planctomycetota bacterium]
MSADPSVEVGAFGRKGNLPQRFRQLLHRFLFSTSRGVSRPEFLRQACQILAEFSDCDVVEIRVDESRMKTSHSTIRRDREGLFEYHSYDPAAGEQGNPTPATIPEELLEAFLHERVAGAAPFRTRTGSFWTGDAAQPILLRAILLRDTTAREGAAGDGGTSDRGGWERGTRDVGARETALGDKGPEDRGSRTEALRTIVIGGEFLSLAVFPIAVDEQTRAALLMGSRRRDFFSRDDILFYEAVAETLAASLAHQSTQWALRERVKELTCLYGIAKVAQSSALAAPELLQRIVDLLPPGWQYPRMTQARIMMDGESYRTAAFQDGPWMQGADIVISGKKRGRVEVAYTQQMPTFDEGPFLKEERNLINEVARQVGLIIEHRDTDEEKARLQEQLRHADRLATIGKLAAGAAHELNEPLLSILGFAQLIKKLPDLPAQARADIDKIETASLGARDVVQKLLIFARQARTRKSTFNLNVLIRKGLYILESRCTKDGIKLLYKLDPDLPEITADPSQIQQMIVNLMVNAMQAMPEGGQLTIETRSMKDRISVVVEDTGVGMTPEVLNHMFVPFFTTKEVGRGTGLGLSVVHGIVSSHGGEIRVTSEPGKGSRFEVLLPRDAVSASEQAG